MKKIGIYLLILFFAITSASYSQDIIILKNNNDTIYCNIIKDHLISLDYYLHNSKDTTLHNIQTEEIDGYILKSNVDKQTAPNVSFKQYTENMAKESTVNVNKKIEDIQYNLTRCHKQYKTGTTALIVGLGISIIGDILLINNGTGAGVLIIGSSLMLVGGIIQIDSHKYIGKAGAATGVSLSYKF